MNLQNKNASRTCVNKHMNLQNKSASCTCISKQSHDYTEQKCVMYISKQIYKSTKLKCTTYWPERHHKSTEYESKLVNLPENKSVRYTHIKLYSWFYRTKACHVHTKANSWDTVPSGGSLAPKPSAGNNLSLQKTKHTVVNKFFSLTSLEGGNDGGWGKMLGVQVPVCM